MTEREMQNALARHYDYSRNIIIPNVSHGFLYSGEADLLIATPAGYLTEIEIKVSRSDMLAESKKRENVHNDPRVSRFYYAFPFELLPKVEALVPDGAGIITVDGSQRFYSEQVKFHRPIKRRKGVGPISAKDMQALTRLGYIRAWSWKQMIHEHRTGWRE